MSFKRSRVTLRMCTGQEHIKQRLRTTRTLIHCPLENKRRKEGKLRKEKTPVFRLLSKTAFSDDLTWRNQECIAFFQVSAAAFFDLIAKENILLFSGQNPLLVQMEILFGGWNQPENLQHGKRFNTTGLYWQGSNTDQLYRQTGAVRAKVSVVASIRSPPPPGNLNIIVKYIIPKTCVSLIMLTIF